MTKMMWGSSWKVSNKKFLFYGKPSAKSDKVLAICSTCISSTTFLRWSGRAHPIRVYRITFLRKVAAPHRKIHEGKKLNSRLKTSSVPWVITQSSGHISMHFVAACAVRYMQRHLTQTALPVFSQKSTARLMHALKTNYFHGLAKECSFAPTLLICRRIYAVRRRVKGRMRSVTSHGIRHQVFLIGVGSFLFVDLIQSSLTNDE